MAVNVFRTLGVGVISTLSMDLLSVLALRLRVTAPLSPNLMGRWFASVARAQPLHADIARTPAVNHEVAIAFPVHYAIGAVLAALYVWGTRELGWPARSLAVALAFGLSTNVFPWLLMFPAMGYGFFGVNGPAGTRLFVSSLVSHGFFGAGLWIAIRTIGGS
ncbi:MAG TPA: DUF2938 family protein [Vicinamibacterales bacterium]|nr:DUF2938 family protein [Vicinamibacterales bacterium]